MFSELIIRLENSLLLSGKISSPHFPKGWIIFVESEDGPQLYSQESHFVMTLNREGFGIVFVDLLTSSEKANGKKHYDVALLAWRIERITEWFEHSNYFHGEPIAYLGKNAGSAAALIACGTEHHPCLPYTLISFAGRPDLVGVEKLRKVHIPVLFLVDYLDKDLIRLNNLAASEIREAKVLVTRGSSQDEILSIMNRWLNHHLPAGNVTSKHA